MILPGLIGLGYLVWIRGWTRDWAHGYVYSTFIRGLAYHAWSTPIELGYQLDPYQTLIAPGLFDGDMDESALPLGFTAQNPRHSGGIMFTLPTQILDQDNL